jgi:hypothetical protein
MAIFSLAQVPPAGCANVAGIRKGRGIPRILKVEEIFEEPRPRLSYERVQLYRV